MAKRKPRRTRSDSPGVVLIRRDRGSSTVWLARWSDPAIGARRECSLTRLGLTTAEARAAWCRRRADTLAQERRDLAAGKAPTTATRPADAVAAYFARREPELRPNTLVAYRGASLEFLAWCAAEDRTVLEDLDPPALTRLRDAIIARPSHASARGGSRGERRATRHRRAPRTVNKTLTALGTMLGDFRRRGLLPKLTSDDLADGLRKLKAPRGTVTFLHARDLRRLLRAALRHDRARFDLTRSEHHGRQAAGSTRRHDPWAPFVLFVLLTGMRFSEAARLPWSAVDFEAGAIVLPPALVKTAEGRRIPLDLTPALTTLLRALKLRAGAADRVFPHVTRTSAKLTRARLTREYGAPEEWNWQQLRRTCGTFLACSDLYPSAGVWHAAQRLGHGVDVAQKHYYRVVTVPPGRATLESVMTIEAEARRIVATMAGTDYETPAREVTA